MPRWPCGGAIQAVAEKQPRMKRSFPRGSDLRSEIYIRPEPSDPFQDSELEKLYSYLRFPVVQLPPRDGGPRYVSTTKCGWATTAFQKISEGSIDLQGG